MSDHVSIVWFRRDLRVDDHPALAEAARRGPVVCVFIRPDASQRWAPTGFSARWMEDAITSVDRDLRDLGNRLIVLSGDPVKNLTTLATSVRATRVFWNKTVEPAERALEDSVERALRTSGVEPCPLAPSDLRWAGSPNKKNGNPYLVFTAFWRGLRAEGVTAPIDAPRKLHAPSIPNTGESLAKRAPSREPLSPLWERFLNDRLKTYERDRDFPAIDGTSGIAPYLAWGEVSPRRLWSDMTRARFAGAPAAIESYRRQLAWREFARHLLWHFPTMPEHPLRERFAAFPWDPDESLVEAWRSGQTGVPLVDAGMRELRATGRMPNRVRMVVASFLTKHLLQPWQVGEEWFWNHLIDADLANNAMGWQWVAGCGVDAAPYFRVFNPSLQGTRFDPTGAYVRRWIPELADVPDRHVHEPWKLGKTYAEPVVNLRTGAMRALAAYSSLRKE